MNASTFQTIATAISSRFSSFGWNATTQQFTGAGGKAVPPKTARVVVDEQIAATGRRLEKLGEALKKADRGAGWVKAVEDYAAAFREERKALTLQVGALGDGGLHPMTREAWARMEASNEKQFAHHDDVIAKLLEDPDYVDSGMFAGHGDRYARTARFDYENERGASHEGAGFKWEMRTQHSINGCSECNALDLKVVPIGTNPDLGACECGPGCECTETFYVENPED